MAAKKATKKKVGPYGVVYVRLTMDSSLMIPHQVLVGYWNAVNIHTHYFYVYYVILYIHAHMHLYVYIIYIYICTDTYRNEFHICSLSRGPIASPKPWARMRPGQF